MSSPDAVSGQSLPAAETSSAASVMKLIQDQLAEERSTKSSLEARAIGVITSSGALATLLFALAALVTNASDYELPSPARWALGLTLLAFVAAAVLAILVVRPATYLEVTIESLQAAAAPAAMSAPAVEGDPEIAAVLVDIIASARAKNAAKAGHLRDAVACQVVGAVLLAAAVGTVLIVG